MTVFFNEEENSVVANNADEFAHFDENGELVIECDEMGRGVEKLKEFANQFERAVEANEE